MKRGNAIQALTALTIIVFVVSGCGDTDLDSDSSPSKAKKPPATSQATDPPRSGDVSQPNATAEKCGEITKLPGGVTVREECGDARVTISRKESEATMIGSCITGKTWFELVAGTAVMSSKNTPKAGTAPGNRVVLNIGPRTGNPAGSFMKKAPRDGTYSPVVFVGTLDGSSFSAFASSSATLRGGRTEGTFTGVEPDGTVIKVKFTCRKLPSK